MIAFVFGGFLPSSLIAASVGSLYAIGSQTLAMPSNRPTRSQELSAPLRHRDHQILVEGHAKLMQARG